MNCSDCNVGFVVLCVHLGLSFFTLRQTQRNPLQLTTPALCLWKRSRKGALVPGIPASALLCSQPYGLLVSPWWLLFAWVSVFVCPCGCLWTQACSGCLCVWGLTELHIITLSYTLAHRQSTLIHTCVHKPSMQAEAETSREDFIALALT